MSIETDPVKPEEDIDIVELRLLTDLDPGDVTNVFLEPRNVFPMAFDEGSVYILEDSGDGQLARAESVLDGERSVSYQEVDRVSYRDLKHLDVSYNAMNI